jgi:hypothetical protein
MSNLSGQTFVGKFPAGSLLTLRRLAWTFIAIIPASGPAFLSAASHAEAPGTSAISYRSAAKKAPNTAAPALSIASIASPKIVTAGASAPGYVILTAAAPPGGVVVNLWTSGSPAFVPSSVTVAPGATRGTFKITTVQTPAAAQPVITAFYKGVRKTATLTVKPGVALISVSAAPAKVVAGDPAKGAVTLSDPAPAGGLAIQLWTNGSPAFVPQKVTVPAGATKAAFPITTTATTTAAQSTITAFYNGASKTVSFTVAPAPGLASVTAPSSIVGGESLSGSVTFSAPAPAKGVVIDLWTSGSPAFVPSSVTIPAGGTSAAFKIRTIQTSATARPVITAFYKGVSKTAVLTVTPAPALSNVSIVPDKVKAGASTTGAVTLNTAAPSGGLIVDLWTNGSAAVVPPHVTVPAGAVTVTFPVTITPAATAAQDTITAFYKGVRKTANVNVVSSVAIARTQRH